MAPTALNGVWLMKTRIHCKDWRCWSWGLLLFVSSLYLTGTETAFAETKEPFIASKRVEEGGRKGSGKFFPESLRAPLVLRFHQPTVFISSKKIKLNERQLRPQMRPSKLRLALITAGILGGNIGAHSVYSTLWGKTNTRFRLGNDWRTDNARRGDELLHVQGSYHLTLFLAKSYQWAGYSKRKAQVYGAGMAALSMTWLEILDGKRQGDAASLSDFSANFLGIALGIAKQKWPALQRFDLHMSYKPLNNPFQQRRLLQYENLIHWLSYRTGTIKALPLNVSAGYSVENAFQQNAQPVYYLGIGVKASRLLQRVSGSSAGAWSWLSFWNVGLHFKIR